MIFNYEGKSENELYPESITLQNQSIENVTNFRYLGNEIKFNEPSTGEAEVNLRIL